MKQIAIYNTESGKNAKRFLEELKAKSVVIHWSKSNSLQEVQNTLKMLFDLHLHLIIMRGGSKSEYEGLIRKLFDIGRKKKKYLILCHDTKGSLANFVKRQATKVSLISSESPFSHMGIITINNRRTEANYTRIMNKLDILKHMGNNSKFNSSY